MSKKKNNSAFLDSDADGLSDEEEKNLGTNPNSADTDNDQLGDFQEVYIYGTNPNDPDTDKDGIPDGEEVKHGLNPRGKGKLRDFFIPNKGNNYHPHALRPKRVLFHAGSVLAVKALVVAFMLSMPVTAWLTPDVLLEQQQRIIELTNAMRQNLDIPALKENLTLNQAAFLKVQDMLIGQYFAHMSPSHKGLSYFLGQARYPYYMAGENLAMGFVDAEAVVNSWAKSPTHYANLVDPEYTNIGIGMKSGLFNNHDTTLVAQYFGASLAHAESPVSTFVEQNSSEAVDEAVAVDEPVYDEPNDSIMSSPSENSVLGESLEFPFSEEALEIDPLLSLVQVIDNGEKEGTLVQAEIRVKGAISADLVFNNNKISLAKDSEDQTLWTGSTLVFETDENQIFNPVVLPSVIAKDISGAEETTDIQWKSIVPVKPSLTEQYFFMKQANSGAARRLMMISSWYFKILLGLAIVSLLMMVLIEIKKQHPKHIAFSLGAILIIVAVIVV